MTPAGGFKATKWQKTPAGSVTTTVHIYADQVKRVVAHAAQHQLNISRVEGTFAVNPTASNAGRLDYRDERFQLLD